MIDRKNQLQKTKKTTKFLSEIVKRLKFFDLKTKKDQKIKYMFEKNWQKARRNDLYTIVFNNSSSDIEIRSEMRTVRVN